MCVCVCTYYVVVSEPVGFRLKEFVRMTSFQKKKKKRRIIWLVFLFERSFLFFICIPNFMCF